MPTASPWYVVAIQVPSSKVPLTTYIPAQKPFPPDASEVSGPYLTRAIADAKANAQIAKGSSLPGSGLVKDVTNSLPFSGIDAIGDFFHRLTEKETWTRVGEVVVGGILLYAGIRALSHGSTVAGSGARKSAIRPVKKVAKTVGSVAVPEARVAIRAATPKTTARIAKHRTKVKTHGGKHPAPPPTPAKPRPKTVRESHIYYHKAGKS
jgi:hypothetical protein